MNDQEFSIRKFTGWIENDKMELRSVVVEATGNREAYRLTHGQCEPGKGEFVRGVTENDA